MVGWLGVQLSLRGWGVKASFLALKSTILSQLIPDYRIRVQMDALKGIQSFIKIRDLHDHHQRLLREPVQLLLLGKFKPLKTSFLVNMGID